MNDYRMGPIAWASCIFVSLFLLLPIVIIGFMAFSDANSLTFPPPGYSTRWFSTLLDDPQWRVSLDTSVRVSLYSTLLGLAIGVPLALGLSRGRIGRFRALHGLVAAPLIIPGVSLAIGFYFVSARLHLLNSLIPLVIANTTISMPMIVVAVLAAERSIDPSLEPAARTLGASFGQTLRRITLPLIAPGVVGGAVFAFLSAWDDIVNAVFLGSARIRPFPLKLWNSMQHEILPIVPAATVLMSAVSLSIISVTGAVYRYRRNRMSQSIAQNIVLNKGSE